MLRISFYYIYFITLQNSGRSQEEGQVQVRVQDPDEAAPGKHQEGGGGPDRVQVHLSGPV